MKKLFIFGLLSLLAVTPVFANPAESTTNALTSTSQSSGRSVVFRSTQKLKSRDGWTAILEPSRQFVITDANGGIRANCTYTISRSSSVVKLIDNFGNEAGFYCEYGMSRDGRNLSWITFNGRTFYR